MTFYNTTQETPQLALEFTSKANNQTEAILDYFKKYPTQLMSAGDLEYNQVLADRTPLTSYRRSINTLVRDGKIEQVGSKKSLYDRKEFTYKLIL